MASGGGDPKLANALFRQVEAIWQNTGRSGKLRLVACTYFGLGEHTNERAGSVRTQTTSWLKVRVSVMLPLSRIVGSGDVVEKSMRKEQGLCTFFALAFSVLI